MCVCTFGVFVQCGLSCGGRLPPRGHTHFPYFNLHALNTRQRKGSDRIKGVHLNIDISLEMSTVDQRFE